MNEDVNISVDVGRPIRPREQAEQEKMQREDLLKKLASRDAKISEVLMYAIQDGWVRHPAASIPFLMKKNEKDELERLNFKDRTLLRLERKVPTNDIEKIELRKNMKWIVVGEQTYSEMKISKTGKLIFSRKRGGSRAKAASTPSKTDENSPRTDEV